MFIFKRYECGQWARVKISQLYIFIYIFSVIKNNIVVRRPTIINNIRWFQKLFPLISYRSTFIIFAAAQKCLQCQWNCETFSFIVHHQHQIWNIRLFFLAKANIFPFITITSQLHHFEIIHTFKQKIENYSGKKKPTHTESKSIGMLFFLVRNWF